MEGHWVERDDWFRGGGLDYREYYSELLRDARASHSLTARSINPNANCPVCRAPVFFYQNKNGSKVFFDELVPPWPKHPCTDLPEYLRSRKKVSFNIEPDIRSDDEITTIENCDNALSNQPELSFETKYGHKPWEITKVLIRINGAAGVYVVLQQLHGSNGKKVFIHRKSLPRCLKKGSIVMLRKSKISFFAVASMEHIELQIRRIKSAAAFIVEMTANPQDS